MIPQQVVFPFAVLQESWVSLHQLIQKHSILFVLDIFTFLHTSLSYQQKFSLICTFSLALTRQFLTSPVLSIKYFKTSFFSHIFYFFYNVFPVLSALQHFSMVARVPLFVRITEFFTLHQPHTIDCQHVSTSTSAFGIKRAIKKIKQKQTSKLFSITDYRKARIYFNSNMSQLGASGSMFLITERNCSRLSVLLKDQYGVQ